MRALTVLQSMAVARRARPHRFPEIWCSHCARSFGSGNSGFSHCQDHRKESTYIERANQKAQLEGQP